MEIFKEFFSNLYHFEHLIRWGGYTVLIIIVFAETGLLAGFFLPGDSLLVTAGLVAAIDGSVNIGYLILFLSIAAILGDSTGYWIGHQFGPKIFNREDSLLFHKKNVERTKKFYEKYGAKTIVIARFVPIVRTFAPTVAGVGAMEYKKFILYNVAGGIGWVASMTLVGYFLGNSIPNIDKKIHVVILIVIFVSLIPIFIEFYSSHREKKKEKPAV